MSKTRTSLILIVAIAALAIPTSSASAAGIGSTASLTQINSYLLGQVKSQNHACVTHRRVTLYQEAGANDVKIATVTSFKDGGSPWQVTVGERYYLVALRKALPGGDVCKPATSRTVRVKPSS